MIKHDRIYTSHLGVYALITNNNKILLIKKNRGPYEGLLDLPGGSLEKHESIEEALMREIKEEIGTDILSYTQLSAFSTFFNYHQNNKPHTLRHIAILYKVIINNDKVKYDHEGEDSDGCVWLNKNNINAEIVSPIVSEALKFSIF
ncbi:MAG: NUDIX domain-containing protein [Alphaproteobacteria bacterium]